MSYYLAPSLEKLRDEIDAAWPNRDKKSDGWIGDTSHQARKSDHNPDYDNGGVVRALDIDKDGIDVDELLSTIIRDHRVSYVIYNHKIWGGTFWRDYNGSNPHAGHIHVSLKHYVSAERASDWGIAITESPIIVDPVGTTKEWPESPLPVTDVHTVASDKAWRELMNAVGYANGNLTMAIQRWLRDLGHYHRAIDTVFGYWTVVALQEFLREKGLYEGLIDGKRGPMTINAEICYLNLPANRGL